MNRRAVLVAAALFGLAGCGPGVGSLSIPPPPPTQAVPSTVPPTTILGSAVSLPSVPGSTTTTAPGLGPGRATLRGTVDGPGGPVAGATVLVQRVVGTRAATTEVATSAKGTFTIGRVLGGVYRLRAWNPPDLALTTPVLFWLPDGGTHTVALVLHAYGQQAVVTAAFDPPAPVVGRPVTVAVLVTRPTVTSGGRIRYAPDPGVSVRLLSASWVVDGTGTKATGASGQVDFLAACEAAGPRPLNAVVGIDTVDLHAPPCTAPAPPPASTTTVPKKHHH